MTLLARVEPSVEAETGDRRRIEVSRLDTSTATLTAVAAPQQPVISQAAVRIAPQPEQHAALSGAVLRSEADPEPGAAQPAPVDYRAVTGNRVNLRSGPGTSFAVLTQLIRGDEVEVLTENADGWVKLRALNGSEIGWMSANFLAASN